MNATGENGRHCAMLPISLGNPAFSTKRVKESVDALPRVIGQLILLVVDDLSIYNYSHKSGLYSKSLRRYYSEWREGDERWTWANKLASRLHESSHMRAQSLRMSDCYDSEYLDMLRHVNVLSHMNIDWKKTLWEDVEDHLESHNIRGPHAGELSRMYICEEIALSLWMASKKGITDEYYLGTKYPRAMIEFYRHGLWRPLGERVQLPDIDELSAHRFHIWGDGRWRCEAKSDGSYRRSGRNDIGGRDD